MKQVSQHSLNSSVLGVFGAEKHRVILTPAEVEEFHSRQVITARPRVRPDHFIGNNSPMGVARDPRNLYGASSEAGT